MTTGPTSTPALAWAGAALLGAWLGWELAGGTGGPGGLVGAGLVGTAATIGLVALRGRTHLVTLLVVVVYGALAAAHATLLVGGPLDGLARRGGQADLFARVAAEPSLGEEGRWWTIVRLDRVDGTASGERASLRGNGPPPALGTTVAMTATARPLDPDTGFDQYLRRRHVVAHVEPLVDPDVRAPPGRWLASTEHVRAAVRDAAARGLDGDRAGLAVGLVTGDTRMLSPETEDRMAEVGLTHLVAVSGSNVAIVLAGAALLAGIAGLGARGQRVLVVVAVTWFVVLTRAEPSVLRAAVMAGAVVVARARGVGTEPVHALAVAVLVLVAADPALAGSLGLLLSVSATAGVLVVAPRVLNRLGAWPRPVAVLAAVTIGAQVAVAPVLLTAVGEVPLASVPANLLAVPAAAMASMVAGVGALVAVVHPPAAGVVFAVADPALRLVLLAARTPDLPVVSWHRPVTLVVVAAVVTWLLARRGGRTARLAVALTALVGVFLVPVARTAPATLTVTAIDVGQGDATLVEGAGARILVDGGPDEDAVAAWLRRRGIRRLDLVVLTHPHADHGDGLAAVLAGVDVGAFWLRHVEADSPLEDELRTAAITAGVPVHEPVAGQRATVGGLDVAVLAPPRGRPHAGSDSEVNEMSLVLRVDQGDRRALLTGDVEAEGQAALLRSPPGLRAGVLKVPHHGSATSDPAFLHAVGARVALVSAGRDNDYGHPHPDVVDALEAAGTQVRRTDLEGDIRVEVPRSDLDDEVALQAQGLVRTPGPQVHQVDQRPDDDQHPADDVGQPEPRRVGHVEQEPRGRPHRGRVHALGDPQPDVQARVEQQDQRPGQGQAVAQGPAVASVPAPCQPRHHGCGEQRELVDQQAGAAQPDQAEQGTEPRDAAGQARRPVEQEPGDATAKHAPPRLWPRRDLRLGLHLARDALGHARGQVLGDGGLVQGRHVHEQPVQLAGGHGRVAAGEHVVHDRLEVRGDRGLPRGGSQGPVAQLQDGAVQHLLGGVGARPQNLCHVRRRQSCREAQRQPFALAVGQVGQRVAEGGEQLGLQGRRLRGLRVVVGAGRGGRDVDRFRTTCPVPVRDRSCRDREHPRLDGAA